MILTPSSDPLSNRDRKMLDRAILIAKQSTVKQKHGAVLYKAGKVLAVGVNSTRNEHPTMEIDTDDYSYHAEHAVLRAAIPHRYSVIGATVYVARTNRRHNPVNSMPCEKCLKRLMSAGIKRVVFTS